MIVQYYKFDDESKWCITAFDLIYDIGHKRVNECEWIVPGTIVE